MRPRLLLFACLLALGLTACGADEPPRPLRSRTRTRACTPDDARAGRPEAPRRASGAATSTLAHRGRLRRPLLARRQPRRDRAGPQPGELAAARRDYDRWLDGMQRISARASCASTRSCAPPSTTRWPRTTGALRHADAARHSSVRPGSKGLRPSRVDPEADVAIHRPWPQAVLHEAASTDPIGFLYGLARPYVREGGDLEPGSGACVRPAGSTAPTPCRARASSARRSCSTSPPCAGGRPIRRRARRPRRRPGGARRSSRTRGRCYRLRRSAAGGAQGRRQRGR